MGRPFECEPVQADVDGDPVQPRRELCRPLELRQRPVCPHEGVLREFARVFMAGHEAVAQAIHLPLVALDQHVERLPIAIHARAHQFFVVCLVPIGVQHATRYL
jgi:hypothetical protein